MHAFLLHLIVLFPFLSLSLSFSDSVSISPCMCVQYCVSVCVHMHLPVHALCMFIFPFSLWNLGDYVFCLDDLLVRQFRVYVSVERWEPPSTLFFGSGVTIVHTFVSPGQIIKM